MSESRRSRINKSGDHPCFGGGLYAILVRARALVAMLRGEYLVMRFSTILAIFCSYFLFHGCKPIRSVSSVKHDAGRLALNSYASNWIEVPLSKWFQMFPQDFSLNDGPLQKRLQTWANAMDSAARRTPWGQKNMKHVPHPIVVIINSSEINAYAMGVSVSYPTFSASKLGMMGYICRRTPVQEYPKRHSQTHRLLDRHIARHSL